MKQPIEPKDIRKDDMIRWERNDADYPTKAVEYVAEGDRQAWATRDGIHYLIEPRKPAVELPSVPTLGWATWATTDYLAVWVSDGEWIEAVDNDGERKGDANKVTAFTPATAVPTDALDELRVKFTGYFPDRLATAVKRFLAAVDKANA